MIVGNPGKIVGWVDQKGDKLSFNKDGKSNCGNFYLNDDTLSEY